MKLKRFLKSLIVFFTGNVLSKLLSLLLLPLYTNKLAPDQYGVYDIVISVINLIAPIVFLQIWDGMFRFAFDYKEDSDKYKVINNAAIVFLGGIVVYAAVFFVISKFLHVEYFVYALIYGFLYALQYFYSFASRVFLKNKLFAVTGVLNTLITAVLNIVLILVFNWDIKSLYVSHIVGILVQVVIMEFGVRICKHFRIKDRNGKLLRNMIKFSIPLCISSVSYWLLSGFTKIVVYYQLGAYANGIYAVANRFSSTIAIVVTVVQYAWNETAYLMAEEEDRSKSYTMCVNFMLPSIVFGTIIICFLIKIIFPYFIDAQYADAINIIPATIIGVGMNSLASFFGTLFMTEKNTNYIFITTLIASAINIVASWFLGSLWGLNGVLIILAIAFFVLMVLRLFKLKALYGVKLDAKNISLPIVIALGIIVYYAIDSTILLILASVCCVILFLFSIKQYLKYFLKKKNTKE